MIIKETASTMDCDPCTGCQKEVVHLRDTESGQVYTSESVIRNGKPAITCPPLEIKKCCY